MTFEWHPLLLATEHSEFDAAAERMAFHLAQRLRVPLAAVVPYVSNTEFAAASPELSARADEDVGRRAEAVEAAAAAAEVNLNLEVRGGPELHTEIVDEAVRVGARLIVARRRGKVGFLKRLQVGEMVGKVVAQAPCSVLLVPQKVGAWQRGVMLVVEGASSPQRSQLQDAANAAARLAGSSVHVLTLDAPSASHQKTAEDIVAAARDADCDLIVIARRGNEASAPNWVGGVAHKVVGLADCAVLIHVPFSSPEVSP